MGKDKGAKKKPDSKAKYEIKTRQKSLRAAKDAAIVSKIPARRSASITTTTATENKTSSNGPETPAMTPPPDEEPTNAPHTAHETSESERPQEPRQERDIFDTDMSERATNPPATETGTDDDESETSSENDRLTPTPKATGGSLLSDTPRAHTQQHAPGATTPAPTPDPEMPATLRTTPGATMTPLPNEQAPTPANQPSEAQPAAKGTNLQQTMSTTHTKETDNEEDEDLKELRKLMKETSEKALSGGFRLNVKTFSPAKGRAETTPKQTTKPSIEWEIIRKKDLTPDQCHTSSNNLDMMSKPLIKECAAASEGRTHKLGDMSQILVEKGFKWLFKLMSFTVPKDRQQLWITHAIRSVLSVAGVSLSNMLASVELGEGEPNPHQWTLVSFTKDAYDAFSEIRLLFDPRSQSAISVREWTMDPPRTQIFSIGAVVTTNDSEEETTEAIKSLKETISELIKDAGVTVTRTAMAIGPKSGMVKPVNVHLHIGDSVKETFFIDPASFRGLKISTPKGTRVSSCRFGRLCPNCASDSHVEKKECPWISYKIGEKRINFDIPRDTVPGRTVEPKPEPTKKRKRGDDRSDKESSKPSTLPIMRDARPKPPPAKRQKTDPKGKGRATGNKDSDTMPE